MFHNQCPACCKQYGTLVGITLIENLDHFLIIRIRLVSILDDVGICGYIESAYDFAEKRDAWISLAVFKIFVVLRMAVKQFSYFFLCEMKTGAVFFHKLAERFFICVLHDEVPP